MRKRQSEDFSPAGLQEGRHAGLRGLDGAADGGGADEVDAVEVGECLGEVLALLYSFGGEVGVGDGLVVVNVVVALGVADEVDSSWGHGLECFLSEGLVRGLWRAS